MLNSVRQLTVLIASWAVCAQALPVDAKPDDYVLRAKQFLLTQYPSLDRNLRAVITDGNRLGEPGVMSNFTMELYDLQPKDNPHTCWCSAPALSARFVFDWQTENKELISISAAGPILNGRSDRFVEEMIKHPGWSDTQVITGMNEAGAKFTPDHKGEFLRAVPVENLKPFVGELEVVSATFYLRERDEEGRRSKVNPYWLVQAKWHGPDGHERQCRLLFEPFEGRLTSLLLLGA